MIRINPNFLAYIEILVQKHLDYFILEEYATREVILKQNKHYHSLYIIKSGITKCYLSDENGKDFIQEFLGEGMEFGELEVFSGNLSFCNIEAISNVKLYKISHKNYTSLLENDSVFNKLVMKSLAAKIAYKAPRHSFQQSYSIEENIIKLKKSYPNFDKIFSKKDIANYLGITLRSLNRTLNNLN
ncbi:Crp/Fnr family transcriptional regulator [uncultured Tenacibaculum sp.]|uniref:Crp/Fnr family transcriptional regulator n=1 Tax=uncultured Tenacibaculum sp. TaxID=174713 RepID=UPI00263939D5|nr:Crp/Fnr family transcriptional regulator [uncultured Tenacibaculum sp.]